MSETLCIAVDLETERGLFKMLSLTLGRRK